MAIPTEWRSGRVLAFRAVVTWFESTPGLEDKSVFLGATTPIEYTTHLYVTPGIEFRSHQYRAIFLILAVHDIGAGNVLNGKKKSSNSWRGPIWLNWGIEPCA